MVNTLHVGHGFLDMLINLGKKIFYRETWVEINKKIDNREIMDDCDNIWERICKANRKLRV